MDIRNTADEVKHAIKTLKLNQNMRFLWPGRTYIAQLHTNGVAHGVVVRAPCSTTLSYSDNYVASSYFGNFLSAYYTGTAAAYGA